MWGTDINSFKRKTGVRQGCFLSLTIFNYKIDWIIDTTRRHSRSIQFSPKHPITDVGYVDDEIMLNNVSKTATRIGFGVNVNKTKVFSFSM